MGDPNLLEGILHYFHDNVFTNLMKLMNSPSLTKHKDLASMFEDDEAKNTTVTRKNHPIIKDTDGSITKEALF